MFCVKPYSQQFLRQVRQVFYRSFPTTLHHSWAEIEDLLERPAHAVVASEQQAIGFLAAERKKQRTYLCTIAVDPQHRTKGVGKALYTEFLGSCSTNEISMHCRRNAYTLLANPQLIKAHGFRIRAEELCKGYFDHGHIREDAIYMQLQQVV